MEMFTYLQVKPEYLGPQYHQYISDLLRMKVEGTVVDKAGLVVAVGKSEAVDSGKLQEGTGLVLVPMKYSAMVLQTFKNEVIDTEVVEVNKLGFFSYLGPLRVFVSNTCMTNWSYSEDTDAVGGPAYVNGALRIRKDMAVRVRVIATKQEEAGMYAVGS